jgi:hypothetical protein
MYAFFFFFLFTLIFELDRGAYLCEIENAKIVCFIKRIVDTLFAHDLWDKLIISPVHSTLVWIVDNEYRERMYALQTLAGDQYCQDIKKK